MARTQRPVRRLVVPAMQVFRHHRMERHVSATAVHLENGGELLNRRIPDVNLVWDPAQEGFVGQRRGIEVRRKHGQHVERHLKLLAGMQSQVVDAALERHDQRFSRSSGRMRWRPKSSTGRCRHWP